MVKRPIRKSVAPMTEVTKKKILEEARACFLRKTELTHVHYAKQMHDIAMKYERTIMAIREDWHDYVAKLGVESEKLDETDGHI